MSKRWRRSLVPPSAWAVALTTTVGCDEPLPCQLAAQDMAAPPDERADMAGMTEARTTFSCRCTDQFGVPLQGVKVSLGGRTATSDAEGRFTLTDVPVTARVITLDATHLEPPPEAAVPRRKLLPKTKEVPDISREAEVKRGINQPGSRRYAKISQEVTLQPGMSYQREQPFVLPLSQPLEDLSELLDAEGRTVQEVYVSGPYDPNEPALQQAELHIAQGTKVVFPPNAPRALSLTWVPPALTPGTLEEKAGASFVVMIQPIGTTFDPPARLVLPVSQDAQAGDKQDLMHLDLDTGRYVRTGSGTVEETVGTLKEYNSLRLLPDRGTGIARASFHLALCPPVTLQGTVRLNRQPVAGARVQVQSQGSLGGGYASPYPLPGAVAVTDASGRYSLGGLRVCSLYSRAWVEDAQGVWTLSSPSYFYNHTGSAIRNADHDIDGQSRYRRFHLRVRVRNRDDQNRPFQGVSVYVSSCLAGECYGETDAQGEVLFRDVLGPPGGRLSVQLCQNYGGYLQREVDVPDQAPRPPACGLFQAGDVQELDISTNCGSGSG
ncbi:MAG: hypothetical protein RMK29_18775 [Myxococcales bacterium]|nr:hypothetical protein [Myxococcales bacterium]